MGGRNRIVVQIEPHVGCFTDVNGHAFVGGIGIIGQAQQTRTFLLKRLSDAHRAVFRTGPARAMIGAPMRGLGVEVVQIAPAARGKKRLAHIANGAFDPPFLIPPGHRHRAGFKAVMTGKLEQRWMKADRLTAAFQHRAF